MNITDVANKYAEVYGKVLDGFYPSKRSIGFTEKNLTANFIEAYREINREQNGGDLHVWYEFPFGEGNDSRNHLDAIIINKTAGSKEILLIESKRINAKYKVEEVAKDVGRIIGVFERREKEFAEERGFAGVSEYTFYGVILMDVWNEKEHCSRFKKEVAETANVFFSRDEFRRH